MPDEVGPETTIRETRKLLETFRHALSVVANATTVPDRPAPLCSFGMALIPAGGIQVDRALAAGGLVAFPLDLVTVPDGPLIPGFYCRTIT
jgi:hypothetical protein